MSAQAIGLPGDDGRHPKWTSQEVYGAMAETATQIKLREAFALAWYGNAAPVRIGGEWFLRVKK